jgi:hypothetical protein
VQGGATGAIVVDGIENIQPAVAGMPERILLLRDQGVAGNLTPGGNVRLPRSRVSRSVWTFAAWMSEIPSTTVTFSDMRTGA